MEMRKFFSDIPCLERINFCSKIAKGLLHSNSSLNLDKIFDELKMKGNLQCLSREGRIASGSLQHQINELQGFSDGAEQGPWCWCPCVGGAWPGAYRRVGVLSVVITHANN